MAFDEYTKALLHMNGTDASTTFTDEIGKTFTAYGNAQLDTAYKKFGSASGLFDGTGDYVSTGDSDDWDFGTGDFTIDFWIRRVAHNQYMGLVCSCYGLTGWAIAMGNTDYKPYFASNASGSWQVDIISSTALSDATWTHLAVVRYGNTLKMYLNGSQVASCDCTGWTFSSCNYGVTLGRAYVDQDAYYYKGHLDEVRISKGIARWTTTFTPPTEEYSGVADATIDPPAATASAAVSAPTITAEINVTVQPPVAMATAEALSPTVTTTDTTLISPPAATATAAAAIPTITVVFHLTIQPPAGTASAAALAPQVILFVGTLVSPPVATASAVCNVPLIILSPLHVILDGRYISVTPSVNRVYVIGRDQYGNPVFGSSSDSDEISLVGERLDFQQEVSVPTDDEVADVAVAIIAKRRLTKRSGYILIPPNCGQELWDVIWVKDTPTAQVAQLYRVTGIRLEYLRGGTKPKLTHKLILGAR